MNANSGLGNNISRDIWETPKKLFKILDEQYRFKTDCCSSNDNKKCEHYYTMENSFLIHKYFITPVWMNPPFSKADIMFQHFFKYIESGVAIYRCDNMETKIWQDIIFPNTDWIFIPNKRINYEGLDGNSPGFPSALIGVGLTPPRDVDGVILIPKYYGNTRNVDSCIDELLNIKDGD